MTKRTTQDWDSVHVHNLIFSEYKKRIGSIASGATVEEFYLDLPIGELIFVIGGDYGEEHHGKYKIATRTNSAKYLEAYTLRHKEYKHYKWAEL